MIKYEVHGARVQAKTLLTGFCSICLSGCFFNLVLPTVVLCIGHHDRTRNEEENIRFFACFHGLPGRSSFKGKSHEYC